MIRFLFDACVTALSVLVGRLMPDDPYADSDWEGM